MIVTNIEYKINSMVKKLWKLFTSSFLLSFFLFFCLHTHEGTLGSCHMNEWMIKNAFWMYLWLIIAQLNKSMNILCLTLANAKREGFRKKLQMRMDNVSSLSIVNILLISSDGCYLHIVRLTQFILHFSRYKINI